MNLNPVIIDGIVVALIVIFAIVQAKRGVYKMVAPIVILVLAVIIGGICAKAFTPVATPWVWDKFGNVIESKIDEKLGDVLDKNLENIKGGLPENIKEGLPENIEDIEAKINKFLQSMDMDKLSEILDKPVEKLVSIAIFIVAFILAIIVLNIIKHACKGIANWFVIGWVNHGLGFILGLAEAVILLFIMVKIAGFAGSDFFDTISKDTVILRQFCNNSLKGVFDFITSPELVNFIKQ